MLVTEFKFLHWLFNCVEPRMESLICSYRTNYALWAKKKRRRAQSTRNSPLYSSDIYLQRLWSHGRIFWNWYMIKPLNIYIWFNVSFWPISWRTPWRSVVLFGYSNMPLLPSQPHSFASESFAESFEAWRIDRFRRNCACSFPGQMRLDLRCTFASWNRSRLNGRFCWSWAQTVQTCRVELDAKAVFKAGIRIWKEMYVCECVHFTVCW